MPRVTARCLSLIAAAGLLVAACGDDSDPVADADAAPAADGTTPAGDAGDGDESALPVDQAGGGGTVTVDGTTYTFTADEICHVIPGDPEFAVAGVGSDPAGEPVHVSAVGPNQLVVILGTHDPHDPQSADAPTYEVDAMTGEAIDGMGGLEVGDGTVRATPSMALRDADNTFTPVGTAEFEASC